MLGFLKKILGFPTDAEVTSAKAPYKVEAVVVNSKTGDLVELPVVSTPAVTAQVDVQHTEVVTPDVAPIKKTRKPRVAKIEATVKIKPVKVKQVVKEKAAKPVKAAAMKAPARRSKKA